MSFIEHDDQLSFSATPTIHFNPVLLLFDGQMITIILASAWRCLVAVTDRSDRPLRHAVPTGLIGSRARFLLFTFPKFLFGRCTKPRVDSNTIQSTFKLTLPHTIGPQQHPQSFIPSSMSIISAMDFSTRRKKYQILLRSLGENKGGRVVSSTWDVNYNTTS